MIRKKITNEYSNNFHFIYSNLNYSKDLLELDIIITSGNLLLFKRKLRINFG